MESIRIIPTEFESSGEMIRGDFVVPFGEGPFPGICKFHGLPGGKDQVKGVATELAKIGFAVLTFDFRGFRRSEGIFSLAGEIEDAKRAVSHLLDSKLTVESGAGVYGASYGGAVAVCAAAQDTRIRAVCLRAPVYDTRWFAKSPMIMPMVRSYQENKPDEIHGIDHPETLEKTLKSMVTDAERFNPMDSVHKIAPRPLLIVHGSADAGIDLPGVRRLHDRAGEPKELVIIEGADHRLSDPHSYTITIKTICSWFNRQMP